MYNLKNVNYLIKTNNFVIVGLSQLFFSENTISDNTEFDVNLLIWLYVLILVIKLIGLFKGIFRIELLYMDISGFFISIMQYGFYSLSFQVAVIAAMFGSLNPFYGSGSGHIEGITNELIMIKWVAYLNIANIIFSLLILSLREVNKKQSRIETDFNPTYIVISNIVLVMHLIPAVFLVTSYISLFEAIHNLTGKLFYWPKIFHRLIVLIFVALGLWMYKITKQTMGNMSHIFERESKVSFTTDHLIIAFTLLLSIGIATFYLISNLSSLNFSLAIDIITVLFGGMLIFVGGFISFLRRNNEWIPTLGKTIVIFIIMIQLLSMLFVITPVNQINSNLTEENAMTIEYYFDGELINESSISGNISSYFTNPFTERPSVYLEEIWVESIAVITNQLEQNLLIIDNCYNLSRVEHNNQTHNLQAEPDVRLPFNSSISVILSLNQTQIPQLQENQFLALATHSDNKDEWGNSCTPYTVPYDLIQN